MIFHDAHNHLQDDRWGGQQEALLRSATDAGVGRMVVNGSCEADWPLVAELARRHPERIIAAFGYHPWYLRERTPLWQEELQRWLDAVPGSTVGEIGLDRWILNLSPELRVRYAPGLGETEPASLAEQEDVFLWQLELAATRHLPASLHCLEAFGKLEELLRSHRRPKVGFLLHSYGGPIEMLTSFTRLGAYFSYPGYFAHERKTRQREVFRAVPTERLLVETDAPDQLPPAALITHPFLSSTGKTLNHPANLPAIAQHLATVRELQPVELARQLATNFHALFACSE